MKSLLKVLLITGIAAISATGLSVGTYFVADTLASKLGSDFAPSKYITAVFPDRTAVAEEFFTDFNDPKHVIYEASKVTFSDNKTGFYYLLQNYYPEYDSIKFAIGIIDNTIVGYKYVELMDGHGVGEEQVDGNKKIFIGYQLGGEDVYGGVTVMDTYDSMKVAIDIALADCQGR